MDKFGNLLKELIDEGKLKYVVFNHKVCEPLYFLYFIDDMKMDIDVGDFQASANLIKRIKRFSKQIKLKGVEVKKC